MKPYYADDAVTLYHANCEELLSRIGSVDLVVTDPPYGMSFRSNRRKVRHPWIVGDDALPVETLKRIVSMASHAAYVFCRWDNLVELPKPKSVIAWVKNNHGPGDLKHEHARQWEACLFYPGKRHQFVKRPPDVVFSDKTGNNLHPTEKPIDLVQQLISWNTGAVVFDPYAGSGTTLMAAKNLGRKAIGIEIDERYCEIIANRCSQTVLDLCDA